MSLRFLFVRAAAGTLAVGSAAPVNLPFETQPMQIVASADADRPVRPVAGSHQPLQRGAVQIADASDLHKDARLLKIDAEGDLPCDSGDWATSPLFGPHAGLAAVLGVTPRTGKNGVRDTALADALDDRPPTGDAASSAFGSIFGNFGQSSLGSMGGGGLFTGPGTGSSGGTGTGGGTVIVGGAGATGGDSGTTNGSGTGQDNVSTGGSTGSSAGTATGGTGTGSGGGRGAGDTGLGGGSGSVGGIALPVDPTSPIDPIQPIRPGTGDQPGDGGTDSHGGGNTIAPVSPGAVPEPSSWATMLIGFGLIGGAMRARRSAVRFG